MPTFEGMPSIQDAAARIKRRTDAVATFQQSAARLCLGVARLSGHEGLYADMCNHWDVPPTSDPEWSRRGKVKNYAFWLSGNEDIKLNLPGVRPTAPRAISLRVETRPEGSSRLSDRIRLKLHAMEEVQTFGLELETHENPPTLWIDSADATSDVRVVPFPADERSMIQLVADVPGTSASLDSMTTTLLGGLVGATWEETLHFGDAIF
ncbi:MAG TPA: hypothetical protein VLH38_06085 [Patescibacteria group bacterium]|nr:hypothetical protein [Patescibacteria group bacterium]